MASKILTNYFPELSALFLGRIKPSMVTVNLTNQCNQKCVYCEIGQDQPSLNGDALSFDDIIWILDEMAYNKIKKISLCGGEPFLFDGVIDLVAYAKKKNIRCSITTNGMTAHKLNEHELNILKTCKTEINISIDSFQDSIQSYTRGTSAALPNALKSLKKLSEMCIPVTVLTVISKYNYLDLFKFFTSAYEKGIKQVLFQPVIYYSNYPDLNPIGEKSKLNVSVAELDLLMNELKNILGFERKHKINSNVYRILPWINHYLKTAESQNGKWFFNDVLHKFFCREIHAIIDIAYDGGIQPCGLSPASISIMENRHLGLMVLWSKATEKIKDDMRNARYYEYCNGCCHHFSRNMLASIFKHPIKNRATLMAIMPNLVSRIQFRILKKIYI
jgi:MoaA/NifB/PqqE/SkfB family radical SAM enzyme